jgi:Cutinase
MWSCSPIKALWGRRSQLPVRDGLPVQEEVKGKNIKAYYIDYPSPLFFKSKDGLIKFIDNTINGVRGGVKNLNAYVRETVLKECKNPKVVLVGYSIGALVINKWLSKEKTKNDLWDYISAVELYGDPLWHRYGPPYPGGTKDTYEGVLRRISLGLISIFNKDPYNNNPQGPGEDLSIWFIERCIIRITLS